MAFSPRSTARALAAGLSLAACGGDAEGPPAVGPVVRPPLAPVSVEAGHEVTEHVQRLAVPAELEPWSVRGRPARVAAAAPGGEPALAAEASEGELVVEIPGRFPSSRTNQVRVQGLFPDAFRVSIQLSGSGLRSFRPPTLVSLPRGEPQEIVFDLELLIGTAHDYDTLILHVDGPPVAFALHAVELADVPLHAFLPAPGEPPRTVDLQGDARPAVGLAPGRAAQAAFVVPEGGARLGFALGLSQRLRPRAGEPRVLVTLEAEGAAPLSREIELDVSQPGKPTWREEAIDLAAFAGRPVTARFEYRCPVEKPGVCALANVELWHPVVDPPTVVLVSSDTHRADHLQVARAGVAIETPAIDALAAGGLFFERCWATTNVTSPSHVALMTGIHPRDTRLVSNLARLSDEAHTLAEVYRDAGWATVAVVSVGHLGPRGTDLCQGFDRVLAPPGSPWRAEVAVDRILEWIGASDGKPLFVFLHLFDAHHPYEPPPSHDRMYYPPDRDPRDPALPPLDVRPGSIPEDLAASGVRDLDFPRAQYRAEVSYLDAQLGRVFAVERVRRGLVAVTSDHGEILEKDGTYFNHGALYPDTLHVPLVLGGDALPAEARRRRVATPVSQLDLARTLLDLSGLTHAEFPGRNLLLALESPGDAPPRFALSAHGHSASVAWHDWYAVLHLRDHQGTLARERRKHDLELHDVRRDPECLRDVAAEHPEVAGEARAMLVDWLARASGRGLTQSRHATATEIAELAALGYAEGASVSDEEPWYDPDSE